MARPDKPQPPFHDLEPHRYANNQQIAYPFHLDPERRCSLGSGRYAKVNPGIDLYAGTAVAIKMIPRVESCCEEDGFKREVKMLMKLTRLPTSSLARFCEIKDHWTTLDHFVIVFERYGEDLATVLRKPRLSAIPLYQAKEISRQLLQAVRFLHENGIIHTDLKPANVVFTNNATTTQFFYGLDNAFHQRTILKSTEIRLIDFGSVEEDPSKCGGMTGSAGFRAPEIMMEWNWTRTVDHFAIGCIIAELVSSKPLLPVFTGRTIEDIAIMDKIIGPFPGHLKIAIQKEFPTAFENNTLSTTTQLFIESAKEVKERVQDRDAARLISQLTNPEPDRRGDLRRHETCKFVRTFEL
ncbi:kinase-like domain-containing protein [Mycena alexandri]|uniref:Kinase-like domain-containing protein n=1 Tax=Mycena alexandri TaxID=1745969 RepID=A0AAD6S1F6_9AGAR|nr:kinase-like domain-containing protein [Mycena alexandri]